MWLIELRTQHSVHEDGGSIPALSLWVKDLASPQAVSKCISDPVLPWLWCRLAAIAPIPLLAWEFPYAPGAAIKRKKKKKEKAKLIDLTIKREQVYFPD